MGRSTTNRDMATGTGAGTTSLQEALQRGIAATEKGERDEAHRIFKETADLHPEVPDVWVWLGGTSAQLDEAEQAFSKAHELDPDNERASLGLRWVQLRKTQAQDQAAAQPAITGEAVPAPPGPVWDQALAEQPPIETVEAHELVNVPEVPVQPEQRASLPPIWERTGTEAAGSGETPQPRTRTGLPSNVTMILLAALILVLVALGYWYFFIR